MWIMFLAAFLAVSPADLQSARDRQDRVALQKMTDDAFASAAQVPKDPDAQYRAALASSDLAEVALELRDRKLAEQAAERGVKAAELAVALKPQNAEYYRILGTLCGQVVPANLLTGLSYGKRAKDAIDKAVALDAKSPSAYMARGVGNYYLPEALGGGLNLAVADFRKAIELAPKDADSWLWLGIALRKQNKNSEAREAFAKSVEFNPHRIWAKEQLDKTPAK